MSDGPGHGAAEGRAAPDPGDEPLPFADEPFHPPAVPMTAASAGEGLRFELSEEDYARAWRLHQRHTPSARASWWILRIMALLLLAIGVLALVLRLRTSPALPIVIGLALLWMQFLMARVGRRIYRGNRFLQLPTRVRIADGRLCTETDYSGLRFPIDEIIRVVEDDRVLLAYMGFANFYVIPKATPELAALCDELRERTGGRARR